MMNQNIISGLDRNPKYFFLQSGKYSKSIAQVNLVYSAPQGRLNVSVIYSPTWQGISSPADLHEETWFSGEGGLEKLQRFLIEHNAVPISANAIPNWERYFEGGNRQWFENVEIEKGEPVDFALATWSLSELLTQLASLSMKQTSMSWIGRAVRFRRLKFWTRNTGLISEMHEALALRGLALAVVPIDKNVTVSESWDLPK